MLIESQKKDFVLKFKDFNIYFNKQYDEKDINNIYTQENIEYLKHKNLVCTEGEYQIKNIFIYAIKNFDKLLIKLEGKKRLLYIKSNLKIENKDILDKIGIVNILLLNLNDTDELNEKTIKDLIENLEVEKIILIASNEQKEKMNQFFGKEVENFDFIDTQKISLENEKLEIFNLNG